jgi:hypothetical protein
MMGERGASANAMSRSVQELGYFEGMDLSRIEQNRTNKIASLEAQKTAVAVGARQSIIGVNNQESSAQTGAFLGTLGSGVRIGADYYRNQTYLDIAKGCEEDGVEQGARRTH